MFRLRLMWGVSLGCGVRKIRLLSLVVFLLVCLALLARDYFQRPGLYAAVAAGTETPDCLSVNVEAGSRRSKVRQGETLPRLAGQGQNIKVGRNTEVHIKSAVQREDYPVPDAFNVVLTAWVDRRRDKHSFVCCFTNSASLDSFVEVPAQRMFIDERLPSVAMRYALFACTLDAHLRFTTQSDTTFNETHFPYVAFSESSCQTDVTYIAHEIVKPRKTSRERSTTQGNRSTFAVCLKIAYGELSPQSLVEWFEFAKIVGVSVVHVYYHIISETTMAIFRHYESSGFAVLVCVTPAALEGHPPRGLQRPRWEEQAWMDGTVACNDCLQRLHQHQFITFLDLDELLIPMAPFSTLEEVMQAAVESDPQAGAFYMDSYIVVLDWPATDNTTSISFLRHLDRSLSSKLDSYGKGKSSPKVIIQPRKVKAVSTHGFVLQESNKGPRRHIPTASLNFLHYRTCKDKWHGCRFERTRDRSLLRFRSRWLLAMSQVPLVSLGCGRDYANAVKVEATQLSGIH